MSDQVTMQGFSRFRLGGLGRNTLVTTSGLAARAALQAAYLIVLSRWLGAQGYGLFAGSVAAAILLAPLAGWGMGYVFTEKAAQWDGRLGALWRAVAWQAVLSGLFIALVVVAVIAITMKVRVSITDIAWLAFAELVAAPLTQVSAVALMALNRATLAAVTTCLIPLVRLLCVLALAISEAAPSVHAVVLAHCLGAVIASGVAMFIAARIAGRSDGRRGAMPGWRTLATAGWPYAVSAFAGSAYFEIDKVLILQLVGAGEAGTYTAAFRVVLVLALPVMALQGNALPRLFAAERSEQEGLLVKRMVTASLGYGVLAMLFALTVAPLMPLLFGPGFQATSRFVAMLSIWVPLFALHLCGATALMAAGAKIWRAAIGFSGLALVVALDLLLLPRMGVDGAILALLIAETIMAIACWMLLSHHRRSRFERARP